MRSTAGRRDRVARAVWAHSDMRLEKVRGLLEREEMTRRNENEAGDAQLPGDDPGQAAAVPA